MDLQEAYAKADIKRLQNRVYDLLAENERLRAFARKVAAWDHGEYGNEARKALAASPAPASEE